MWERCCRAITVDSPGQRLLEKVGCEIKEGVSLNSGCELMGLVLKNH